MFRINRNNHIKQTSNGVNNFNDQKLEKVLEKTLEYLDNGKSPAEILNLFPEHQETLKEIFSTINLLKKERGSIVPYRELLKQIIEHLPVGVTNGVNPRYLYRKEVEAKDRPSLLSNIITKFHESTALKWKIIVPAGIVTVIALFAVYSQFGAKSLQYTTEQTPTQPKQGVTNEATPPTATGNEPPSQTTQRTEQKNNLPTKASPGGPLDTALVVINVLSVKGEIAYIQIEEIRDYNRYPEATYPELKTGDKTNTKVYNIAFLDNNSNTGISEQRVGEPTTTILSPKPEVGRKYLANMSYCVTDYFGRLSCKYEGWSSNLYPL